MFLALIALAVPFLEGCSGGGRVEVNGSPTVAEQPASLPPAPPAGLTAEQARLLVTKSLEGNEAARQAAIARVAHEAERGFDWVAFWEGLAPFSRELGSAAVPTRALLLDLHRLACDADSFKAFALFALRFPAEAGSYLAGASRQCDTRLGPSFTFHLLKELGRDVDANAEALARLLALEYSRREPDQDWAATIGALSPVAWRKVATDLEKAGNGEALVALVKAQDELDAVPNFTATLVSPLLRSKSDLLTATRKLGLGPVIQLLMLVRPEQLGTLTPAQLGEFLAGLLDSFEPAQVPGERFERWGVSLRRLAELRALEKRLGDRDDGPTAVSWLEKLQKKMEADLRADTAQAAEFLRQQPANNLDAAWFKLRLFGRAGARQLGLVLDTVPLYRLDQILAARLGAHFAEGESARRAALAKLCELLAEAGVPSRTIEPAGLASELAAGLAPGCHQLKIEGGASATVELERGAMAYDSVLAVPGANLNVTARSFDGAFIDLSATATHPDLPAEPTDSSFDAIVFPIVLGLKIPAGVAGFEAGVHYFVVHYPYRMPQAGPAAVATALPGFDGGVLRLAVSSGDEAGLSFEPTVLSYGGPGQMAVPRRSGGHGMSSTVALGTLSSWVQRLGLVPGNSAAGNTPFDEIGILTARELRALLGAAVRENNKILVYVDPGFVPWLRPESQALIHGVCPGAAGDEAFRACLKKVGAAAARWASTQLDLITTPGALEAVPDFLGSRFAVKDAAPGPVNPDGARGRDGGEEL